jgi:conjugative transfer region protein (TIGR03748 family)
MTATGKRRNGLDGFSIPCIRAFCQDASQVDTTPEAESIMKRSIFNPTHPIAAVAICLAGICSVASVNLQASDIQVGRYSLFATTPTEAQADPLQAMITVQFPDRIRIVGDAVKHLLQQSGYRLAGSEATGPTTAYLMALPLPTVHRRVGPMPLNRALETLAGPAFRLVEDPVHRLVTFERCAMEWQAVQGATSSF